MAKLGHLTSTKHAALTVDKTKSRKPHKAAATEGSCSKGPEKHLKGGNVAFGDVYGFQTLP